MNLSYGRARGLIEADNVQAGLPGTEPLRFDRSDAVPFHIYGSDAEVVWGPPKGTHFKQRAAREGSTSHGRIWTDRKVVAFWQPSEDKFEDGYNAETSEPETAGVHPSDMHFLVEAAKEEKGIDLLPYRVFFTDSPPASQLTVARWLAGEKPSVSDVAQKKSAAEYVKHLLGAKASGSQAKAGAAKQGEIAGDEPVAKMRSKLGTSESAEELIKADDQASDFESWFQGSKAVGPDGNPLRVYHGTQETFTRFDPERMGSASNTLAAKKAFWFASHPEVAEAFSKGGSVNAYFIALKNPLVTDHSQHTRTVLVAGKGHTLRNEAVQRARRMGRDGVIFKNTFEAYDRCDVYAVFSPDQIRPATALSENEDSDIYYGWTKDGEVINAPKVQHDEDAHHIVQQRRLLPDGNPEGWKRWRYRADLETIFWWETPTLADREATEDRIRKLGHYRVDNQVYVGLNSQKPGDRERARKEKMPNFDLDDMEQGDDRLASLAASDMMDVTHIPDAPTDAMRKWLRRIGDSIEVSPTVLKRAASQVRRDLRLTPGLAGFCQEASEQLALLLNTQGVDAAVAEGKYADKFDHYWVKAGDYIVDPTADQFNKRGTPEQPSIVVGLASTLPSYREQKLFGEGAQGLIEREAGETDDHIILGTIKPDLTIRTVDVPLRLGRGATHNHFPKLRGGINWRLRTGTGELLVWDSQYGTKMTQEQRSVLWDYFEERGVTVNALYDWSERRDQQMLGDWRASDQFASVHGINPEEDKVKFKSKVLRSPSGNYERGDWKGWDKMQKLDRQVLGASSKEYVPQWKRGDQTSEAVNSFHGTDAVFDDFEHTNDIGFHFGSAETANARLDQMSGEGAPGEGANIRPVTLNIEKPLRMPDLHDWNPAQVAASLVDLGVIDQAQADAAEIVDKDQVQAWLGAQGYDSIVYANETEGQDDSYIVFDPALIRPRFSK